MIKQFGILFGILFSISAISACSCAMEDSFEESFQRAEGVFAGEVIDIDSTYFGDDKKVVFSVYNVWKGLNYTQLVVTTPKYSASCGYEFEENKIYLVYTNNDYEVSLCSRTNTLESSQEDLELLGNSNQLSDESNEFRVFDWIIFGFVSFLVLLFGFYELFRKDK